MNFEGKRDLEIKIASEKIEKEHFEIFIKEMNKKIREFLGSELLENLTPNFTTTDTNSKLVCQISIMNTFQNYFNLLFLSASCGIPYIILEGTAEDYKKIILKAKYLGKYDFEWYTDRIIPLIQKMEDAKDGKIDINFFKSIIRKEEVIDKRPLGGCCPFYGKYKINYIDGWILKFFGYIKRNEEFIRFSEDKIEGEEINNFPNQILNVPFIIIKEEDNSKINVEFEAGFFGCEQNEKKEVSPKIGWLISPLSYSNKGKKDNQFKKVLIKEEILLFENEKISIW